MNPCIYCKEPVSDERVEAGYLHCTERHCVAMWRREKLHDKALILVPKQGFTIVPRDQLPSGRSSGR